MNPKLKIGLTIVGTALALFLMWYFSTLTGYIVAAAVLSLVVSPVTDWLSTRKIKKTGKFHLFPRWLATLITLMLVLTLFFGILFSIVPIIGKQATTIADKKETIVSQIDSMKLSNRSNAIWNDISHFLQQSGVTTDMNKLEVEITEKLQSWISMENIGLAFSGVLSFLTSFVMGVFAIFFLSFFFIKDKPLFKEILLSIFPKQSQHKITNVVGKTKTLLSRYFTGLLIRVTVMMLLEFIGLKIFNIPNALLIAFIGGLLNIIPFIGPLIGILLGVILAVVSTLANGSYTGIEWVVLKVIGVFLVANIIDNVVNQQLIFSKSVKAHPAEIFLVILAAGYVGGIGGMIIAVPTYTVIRIILKEYLSEFAFISNLTKHV
jgi:predicted PurR-regulated permease PerM